MGCCEQETGYMSRFQSCDVVGTAILCYGTYVVWTTAVFPPGIQALIVEEMKEDIGALSVASLISRFWLQVCRRHVKGRLHRITVRRRLASVLRTMNNDS